MEISSVADPDPGSGAFLTPGSGMVKNIRIRIRDEQPGSYFRELRNHFFGLKYINSLMQIRDGKNSDPGSRMEKIRIRDNHPRSATLDISKLISIIVQRFYVTFVTSYCKCPTCSSFTKMSPFESYFLEKHDQLPYSFPQCCGSMTFWNVSGSADPCL
jgi:hypothetical protein